MCLTRQVFRADAPDLLVLSPHGTRTSCIQVHLFTPYIAPIYYSSFHFLFHYPNITPIYYSSFHFLFHYPNITPICHSSFHFLFHYPNISPIYYSSFHFLFHYPNITPIYYSSFHLLFHYPNTPPFLGKRQLRLQAVRPCFETHCRDHRAGRAGSPGAVRGRFATAAARMSKGITYGLEV